MTTQSERDYFVFGLLGVAMRTISHALQVASRGANKIDEELWKLNTDAARVYDIWAKKTVEREDKADG